jgi:hypothetical protein
MLSSERRRAVVHDAHIGLVSEIAECIFIASNDKRDTGYTGAIDDFKVKIHRHGIAEKNDQKTEPELSGRVVICLDLSITSCLCEAWSYRNYLDGSF